jgi:uncharacterized protein (DUF924 family)
MAAGALGAGRFRFSTGLGDTMTRAISETIEPQLRPEDVLRFWLEEAGPKQWFVKDPAFDALCRERLGADHAQAAAGALAHWRDTAPGCVALCILLDQVPRNIHRGHAAAFATDAMALAVARDAVAAGLDLDPAMTDAHRLFLYLPFEHSETPADQDRAVALFRERTAEPDWTVHAERHRAVIARFGRFPHRNAALGRTSTPAELAFLAQPDSGF